MPHKLPRLAPHALRWIDRWIDPAWEPAGLRQLRQARIVVVEGWLGLLAHAILLGALVYGEVPALPFVEVAAAVGVMLVGLAIVRWGGRVEVAAWMFAITLALTPVFQAAVDLGIRDPALALVMLAPFAGALTSGARLATVSAAIGAAGATVLFVIDRLGMAPEPFSTPDEAALYGIAMVTIGSALSATSGVLYARHTRHELVEAEDESTRLDAALRASEERYRSLFDHIPVGMYRTSSDGRVLLANATLARLIGAPSAEAARAYNASDFYVDKADRERFRQSIMRDGYVRGFETRWRRPGGDIRHVCIDARVALDPTNGQALFYEGAVEDVTAEREARIALHRSEARFKALVQRSSDVVVVADRADRFTYVSPAVGTLLGYYPERLLDTALTDLVADDDRPTARAFLDEARGGAPAANVELRLRHADGHDVFVEGAATALYDDPAVGGLVLNLRDVTERKRAQAVLVQAKRQAEEVAALKSAFLANMSHEIRTPLTAILGFADILREEVPADLYEYADTIRSGGQRLLDTLNDILDFARLDAERAGLVPEPVDAAVVVREAVALLAPLAKRKGLGLHLQASVASVPAVHSGSSLGRVVTNLVGNAIKFTERGEVRVTLHGAPDFFAVRVQDTGVGIADEFLPDLFEAFKQESDGHGRDFEGTGLGLAITKRLVDLMGGEIRVWSRKGEGTLFSQDASLG